MAMRVSGINSGLDTEALVTELVSAYSKKTEKYEKQLTKNEWKTEAWESLNKEIYSMYTSVSNMRYSSAYAFKNATSSDVSKATVTASASAINVTQRLSITSVAQTSYLTGGQLLKSATADTKLSQLGYAGLKSNILVYSADGTKTTINVGGDTTIKDFTSQLEKAGLNATFDENSKRIFVSAKESGAKNDFTIMGQDANGQDALTTLGLSTALYTVDESGKKTFAENSYLGSLYEYYKPATEAVTDEDGNVITPAKTAEENTRENILRIIEEGYNAQKKKYDEANTNRSSLNLERNNEKNKLADMKEAKEDFDEDKYNEAMTLLEAELPKWNTATGAEHDLSAYRSNGEADWKYLYYKMNVPDYVAGEGGIDENVTEDQKAEAEAYAAKMINAMNLTARGNLNSPEYEKEIEAQEAKVKKLEDDYQAQYDAYTAQMEYYKQKMADSQFADLMQTESGVAHDAERRETELNNLVNSVLGVANMLDSASYSTGVATQVHGSDAEIELNGVVYKNNKNSFSINGLNINCTNTTAKDSPIMINVSTDTQAMYDKVKDFLTQYNEIINKITKLYNADSAKDYEPLTDEEKDKMSDTEIEKWETKIKDSLLRRDTTLSSLMSSMINSMMQSYEVNGKKYNLSYFGIHTLGYLNAAANEQNAFHIDGDSDDEKTSGNEDKLMEALNNEPDTLIDFMKQLTTGLYKAVDDKMKSNSMKSAFKVYNDKELTKEASNIKSTISKWEKKVKDQEDYYYKKFAAMEKVLGNLNSQQTAFTNMLGG